MHRTSLSRACDGHVRRDHDHQMTIRKRIRGRWKVFAVLVLGVFILLYLMGYYLGADKQWRGQDGKPIGKERQ